MEIRKYKWSGSARLFYFAVKSNYEVNKINSNGNFCNKIPWVYQLIPQLLLC